MRGDSGVAGGGRVVGVPKFHSWGKCTMPLTNINSDWMFNASSGLCIVLVIYAGYGSGRGQRSRWTNSRWLRTLGYSCKTRRMSREPRHKLAQREAMREISKDRSCTRGQS